MSGTGLTREAAMAAVAAVAGRASGAVGLAARHLESGESLTWNAEDQFGLHWGGPFDRADASRQSSALEVLTAAAALTRDGP